MATKEGHAIVLDADLLEEEVTKLEDAFVSLMNRPNEKASWERFGCLLPFLRGLRLELSKQGRR